VTVVGEAGDGAEAVEIAAREDVDIAILDIAMPRMTGLECVKALREAGLGAGMKVMMVTTESDNVFIESALKYGADEFLMKPFTAESLREKLAMMGLAA